MCGGEPDEGTVMFKRTAHRTILVLTFALAMLGPSVLSVTTADAAPVTPAYVAGSASPAKPGYDAATWSKTYKCAFAGWAHVRVNWQCRLKDPASGVYLSGHSGSFTTGSATTPTYFFPTANVYLCTVANASYADGSDSDSNQSCQ
jgi:hypothetical protein